MPRTSLHKKMLLQRLENLAALHSVRVHYTAGRAWAVLIAPSVYGYEESVTVDLDMPPKVWARDIAILLKKAQG